MGFLGLGGIMKMCFVFFFLVEIKVFWNIFVRLYWEEKKMFVFNFCVVLGVYILLL